MGFFNFLFTSQCPLCHSSAPLGCFCHTCQKDILTSKSYAHRCPHCQLALSPGTYCENCYEHKLILSHIYTACDYIPPLDSLILQFKNASQTHLAHPFATLLYEQLLAQQRLPTPHTLLIPIPSSLSSLRKRHFNPATLFAKSLAKKLHCHVDASLLHRYHSHQMQKNLTRHDRFLHSSRLYYCTRRLDLPKVILVDDILTTGSTLDSAARALLAAGVQQVEAMVIARTANPLSF